MGYYTIRCDLGCVGFVTRVRVSSKSKSVVCNWPGPRVVVTVMIQRSQDHIDMPVYVPVGYLFSPKTISLTPLSHTCLCAVF